MRFAKLIIFQFVHEVILHIKKRGLKKRAGYGETKFRGNLMSAGDRNDIFSMRAEVTLGLAQHKGREKLA